KVPMEVLSLGLLRTGSASMSEALKILGYHHTYHGLDTLHAGTEGGGRGLRDWQYWDKARLATWHGHGKFDREEWDDFLGYCMAATDLASLFAVGLIRAYPEAKVILVECDESKWVKSFNEIIVANAFSKMQDFVIRFVEPLIGVETGKPIQDLLLDFWQAKTPDGIRRNALRVYREHYKRVRGAVPPERLLNYELGSGWGPLCEFLGKPVPGVEFPRINETQKL
ncbi:hypothetical protein BDY21DRAFT_262209, partial [Lineolata rhizophorae]